MLLTSHLAATLLIGSSLVVNHQEWAVALLGGVFVDADHLFVNKKWLDDVKIFFKEKRIVRGVNQHSPLQEFLFGIVFSSILGLVVNLIFPSIRWYILPMFLGIHIMMDSVMKCEHQPFAPLSKWSYWGFVKSGTTAEFVVSTIAIILFFLF